MKNTCLEASLAVIEGFKRQIEAWSRAHEHLSFVYNHNLDQFGAEGRLPKLILVADNPGKAEAEQGAYLVGAAGTYAEAWFQANRDNLGIDFRREVAILNKTPISTASTRGLAAMSRDHAILDETQAFMAETIWNLAVINQIPIWIVGHGDLPRGGASPVQVQPEGEGAEGPLFAAFSHKIEQLAEASKGGFLPRIHLFPHFSHRHFGASLFKRLRLNNHQLMQIQESGRATAQAYFPSQREQLPPAVPLELDADLPGWYTTFAMHHRHPTGRTEEFRLEDPDLQGEFPFLPADLDRVIGRAQEVQAWAQQFDSASGNPIRVTAVVSAWPEPDTQPKPRLVTAYEASEGGPVRRESREEALALAGAFAASPCSSVILQGGLFCEFADLARLRLEETADGARPRLNRLAAGQGLPLATICTLQQDLPAAP